MASPSRLMLLGVLIETYIMNDIGFTATYGENGRDNNLINQEASCCWQRCNCSIHRCQKKSKGKRQAQGQKVVMPTIVEPKEE
jgi:hypothetical protein